MTLSLLARLPVMLQHVQTRPLFVMRLAVRPLQDADGSLFPIGAAAIREDGLAELLGHGEFVMYGIVRDPVHGSP